MVKHWLTPLGLEVNKSQIWDPVKKCVKGRAPFQWEASLNEDPWGLKEEWKDIVPSNDGEPILTTRKTEITNIPETGLPLGEGTDCPSFGNLLGHNMEDDTVTPEDPEEEVKETTIQFDTSLVDADQGKENHGPTDQRRQRAAVIHHA